jgi:glycogen debranching enzyme
MSSKPQSEQSRPPRQPWLHELAIAVHGNATVLSDPGGDIRPGTADGLYVDDARVLSRLQLEVAGEPPTPVSSGASGPQAQFFGAARGLGNPGADPTVEVHRTRVLDGSGLREVITVTSRARETVRADLEVTMAADDLPIASIVSGQVWGQAAPPVVRDDRITVDLSRHRVEVVVDPPPREVVVREDGMTVVRHTLAIDPDQSSSVTITVTPTRTSASQFDADAGSGGVTWDTVRVTADDPRVAPLVAQSLADLQHLLLRDPLAPEDIFAAAGTPWYLTLFGRDSLWTARMMLPFGTELAAGTLRALARRQGTREAPERAEQPGKIPHEARRMAFKRADGSLTLPTLYYGTVDATALWVCLLVDAWRWGLPEPQVRALLPNLHAAVGWLTGPGQPDTDGFLKYLDTTGTGLVNQGWKDSTDSMRFRDGSIAAAPISLIEAQAYAVEALESAADLLDALGEDGGPVARAQATALRDRVNEAFWVDGPDGRYLAMALDAVGRPVDGMGSNMGHVLGTGVLTPQDSSAVAARLTGPELLDDFGLRTLGRDNGGFNPIGYHTGSIWTHDTAIAALGLASEGHAHEASRLARSLVAAGAAFGNRWPELYSGLPMMGRPAPYPAACRPQAWSAASAGALVTVALGLRADLPSGVLHVTPPAEAPFGAIRLEGLRLGAHPLVVEVNRLGEVRVDGVPEGVQVRGTT